MEVTVFISKGKVNFNLLSPFPFSLKKPQGEIIIFYGGICPQCPYDGHETAGIYKKLFGTCEGEGGSWMIFKDVYGGGKSSSIGSSLSGSGAVINSCGFTYTINNQDHNM